MSAWYEIDTFDKTVLASIQSKFDLNFNTCGIQERSQWFENLFLVAQHNVGVAHCINQHQSARNSLSFAGLDFKPYADAIGCYSIHHDIDTISINNGIMSGTKHWITSANCADFVVFKVGHHSNKDRKLVFVELAEIEHSLIDNNYNPIGLKIAKPMSLVVDNVAIPSGWILHNGKFHDDDAYNTLMSFYKYGFITNFLGCAIGLYYFIKSIVDGKNYDLQFELQKVESLLFLLKENWRSNMKKSIKRTLDTEYWNWYDTQYNQTKQALSTLLKIAIDIGNSKLYDSNSAYSQRFRDAVVWNSHGKAPVEQLLMSNPLLTRENK